VERTSVSPAPRMAGEDAGPTAAMASDATTPLMRQYKLHQATGSQGPAHVPAGRLLRLFYDDAVVAARELEITLTARNKEKGAAIPMCGVPYHSAEGYIARLIQKGYRVAICDQMEDPRVAKKLVKREITRIVTPGTATDAQLLRSHENNYLAAVSLNGSRAGFAHVDVSTGEFRATELATAEIGTRHRATWRPRSAHPGRPAAARARRKEPAPASHGMRELDVQP